MPDGLDGLRNLPAFVRSLMKRRPAVFHANLTWPLACRYGLVAATLARVPAVVATVHSHVEVPFSRSDIAKQALIAAGVDRYIAVSRDMRRHLIDTFHVPARKIEVVHNGISCEPFNMPHDPQSCDSLTGSKRPLVLTVARLDAQKGHRYLLEAARLLPGVQFALAGDGPERADLEEEARRLDVSEQVAFLGNRRDIPDLLACCDVFALPSLFEGLPIAVLEAMAAGKPVVATATGGTNEAVVAGKTGLMVPPRDPEALAAAIRTLLCDPARAARLAAAGRERVEKEFSLAEMVRRTTGIYERLLSARGIP